MRRAFTTRAALAAVSLMGLAAITVLPFAASAAPTPTEVAVFPADQTNNVLLDKVVFAGETGYLHKPQGTTTYVWTTYATGANRVVTGLPTTITPLLAGGDRFAYPSAPPSVITEIDLAANTTRTFTLPSGVVVGSVNDNHVLVRTTVNTPETLEVLTYAPDGTFTTAVVTPPAGTTTVPAIETQPIGNPPSVVLQYRVAGVLQYGLLDLTTAVNYPISGTDPANTRAVLSADNVAVYNVTTNMAQFVSRADIVAGTPTTPADVAVTLPRVLGAYNVAMVGDHLVVRDTVATAPDAVSSVAPDGAVAALLAQSETTTNGGVLAGSADGNAYVVGGSSPSDWALFRVSSNGSGTPQTTALRSLGGPLTNAGVTIMHGQVRHIDAMPDLGVDRTYVMYGHDLLDPGGGTATLPPATGLTLPPVITCAPHVACVIPFDIGFGVALLGTNNQFVHVFSTINGVLVNVPAGSAIVGSSDNHLIINNPASLTQYITQSQFSLDGGRGITAAAVSYETLWSAVGNGSIVSTNLVSNITGRPMSTGGTCRPQELQATTRWVYWSCGGNAAAGVIDLQTGARFTVPSGPALLGDGYLVRHVAGGDLVLTDFHTDSASAPVTVANVPAGPVADDRNVTYSVDKFGGDIAYVAADNSVHVVDPDVPPTQVAVGTAYLGFLNSVSPGQSQFTWSASIWLTRPITSWSLQIRRAATGELVHTDSGGFSDNAIQTSWDGFLSGGAKAISGPYSVTLSVTPAGQSTAVTVPLPSNAATMFVSCGAAPFRSYDCSGASSFLAVKPDGEGHWFTAIPPTGVLDGGYTETWPLGTTGGSSTFSALVPFGDFNGDGFDDLIVRDTTGTLWAYDGFGQAYFGQNTKQKIGTGWNIYNALVAPGDLTSDGIADLLGRDSTGKIWLYKGSGAGTFAARVQIASGWSGYKILVGAGDLNGDGFGDVLATDSSGSLWRFNGKLNGFAAPVKLGGGWQVYNAIIGVGDFNNDGHNDLVARNASGALFLYRGNGDGTFQAALQIGTGFQAYSKLF